MITWKKLNFYILFILAFSNYSLRSKVKVIDVIPAIQPGIYKPILQIDSPSKSDLSDESSHIKKNLNVGETTKENEKINLEKEVARQPKTEWNFIVYLAANNNLHKFAQNNLRQMFSIGSTEYINVLVQLDMWGQQRTTRYFIEKDNPKIVETFDTTIHTATGTSESLYDCVKWAHTNFPSKHTALILWNHGSGILDPHIWGKFALTHRDDLFFFNPETCLLEIDRNAILRGIAFNDSFETYIDNKDLKNTLAKISKNILGGRKIDIVGMDACHMAMVEIATQIRESTDYLVASEEIEPGLGWDYQRVLKPFTLKNLTPAEFASHIVWAYEDEYKTITSDYTQSAINLSDMDLLEQNISSVGSDLVNLLELNDNKKIIKSLKRVRTNHHYTTAFYNHNYIDLMHFYKSLIENISEIPLNEQTKQYVTNLKENLLIGTVLLENIIIENASGSSIPNAYGLAIYFPTRTVHSSYLETVFAQTTTWLDFVFTYLKKTRRSTQDIVYYDRDQSENDLITPINGDYKIVRKEVVVR